MVISRGEFLKGSYHYVYDEIAAVKEACGKAHLKVILETAALSDELIRVGAAVAQSAGAQFVKTSTGFGPGGATVEAVALLRATVCSQIGVKASGGIRDIQSAQAMVAAGATRLGTSAGVAIVQGGAGGGAY